MSIVYLNGVFLPLAEASIPVLDRGFIFGDGIYEVIPVYGGKLFRLDEHLLRLQHSLDGIRLENPLSSTQWSEMLHDLVQRNGAGDQSVYLQITRGVAKRDHAFPAHTRPTVFAMCSPLAPLPKNIADEGVAAVTLEDIRWQYCHIKAITLLPNILMRQEAIDRGAAEAVLVRPNGEVTEGAASNIFVVIKGEILTPPKGPKLLPGITRDLILELALAHQIPAREQTLYRDDLLKAEEIWFTSSTREILPVTSLDQRPVGSGKPGPLWKKMMALFQQYKKSFKL